MEGPSYRAGFAIRKALITAAALIVALMGSADAQDDAASGAVVYPPNEAPAGDFFTHWFNRVDAARESQPHWTPPLMTLSPLITELLRVDGYYQQLGNGGDILNIGGGKGLFLVPTETNEFDIGLPTYQQRYHVQPGSGLSDLQFLLLKQRLLSAPEGQGDYIITAALAGQAPTGSALFTNNAYVITPSLLAGKGFGKFSIQAATSVAVPTSHQNTLGTSWATNTTLQYNLGEVFWPEFEVNWTHWLNGTQRGGQDQLFLTFGVIIGPLALAGRLALTVGAGYQFAVAPAQRLTPALTPEYRRNVIITTRLLF
ncbi:MAG: hypothetical protein JOY71_16280 [Acetobacteraceae bacterium]|nr:hypothetical protein [Acetobacteraceae bacterium]